MNDRFAGKQALAVVKQFAKMAWPIISKPLTWVLTITGMTLAAILADPDQRNAILVSLSKTWAQVQLTIEISWLTLCISILVAFILGLVIGRRFLSQAPRKIHAAPPPIEQPASKPAALSDGALRVLRTLAAWDEPVPEDELKELALFESVTAFAVAMHDLRENDLICTYFGEGPHYGDIALTLEGSRFVLDQKWNPKPELKKSFSKIRPRKDWREMCWPIASDLHD